MAKRDILEELKEALAPATKAKKVGNYVIEVNGTIIPARLTRKEVIKQAKQTACSGASINVFKLEGATKVDLPVTIVAEES